MTSQAPNINVESEDKARVQASSSYLTQQELAKVQTAMTNIYQQSAAPVRKSNQWQAQGTGLAGSEQKLNSYGQVSYQQGSYPSATGATTFTTVIGPDGKPVQIADGQSVYGQTAIRKSQNYSSNGYVLSAPQGVTSNYGGHGVMNQQDMVQTVYSSQYGAPTEYVTQTRKSFQNNQQGTIVSKTNMGSRVVSTTVGESREVSRSTHIDTNVRVKEQVMEARERRPSVVERPVAKDLNLTSEKAVITQRVVEKPFDVYVERPVPVYKVVEVPIDVIREIPVEKRIERDVITEIVKEVPIEKIIETPVEVIVEKQFQHFVERPVYVDKYVDVPVQRVVERPVARMVENVVVENKFVEVDEKDIGKYKYDGIEDTEVRVYEKEVVKKQKRTHRNVINKDVEVPIEKIVQREVKNVITREVPRIVERPVYIENVVTKVIEKPVEHIQYNKVEQVVEEEEIVEQIISRPMMVERIVDKPVTRVEEVLIDNPRYIEREIEKLVDVPIEREIVIEKEVIVPHNVIHKIKKSVPRVTRREVPKIIEEEVIVEHVVPVERVNIVHEIVEIPIRQVIDRPVERIREKFVDVIVEKEVFEDNHIEEEQYVEKIVEVPIQKIIERPVFKENIIEVPKVIEKAVYKDVEKIVYKDIVKDVERIVEVPVDVIIENPIPVQKVLVEEVMINKNMPRPRNSNIKEEREDPSLRFQVDSLERNITESRMRIAKTKAEYEIMQHKQMNITLNRDLDYTTQNIKLRELIVEMEHKINDLRNGINQRASFSAKTTFEPSQAYYQSSGRNSAVAPSTYTQIAGGQTYTTVNQAFRPEGYATSGQSPVKYAYPTASSFTQGPSQTTISNSTQQVEYNVQGGATKGAESQEKRVIPIPGMIGTQQLQQLPTRQ